MAFDDATTTRHTVTAATSVVRKLDGMAIFTQGRITFVSAEDQPSPPPISPHALADTLADRYPSISTNRAVLNGTPHLEGTRLTVSRVISALSSHGSFEAALDDYDNTYTRKQFEDALLYARDFLMESVHQK